MDTNVQALKNLYEQLGGDPADVADISTNADMIDAIAALDIGGGSGGLVVKQITLDNSALQADPPNQSYNYAKRADFLFSKFPNLAGIIIPLRACVYYQGKRYYNKRIENWHGAGSSATAEIDRITVNVVDNNQDEIASGSRIVVDFWYLATE